MISKKYATAVMALLMLAAVSGCQKKDDTVSTGPAEQLGRKIDEATAKADQQITDATKETSQKIDKATGAAADKINHATDVAGQKLEQAGEKMQEKAHEHEASTKDK